MKEEELTNKFEDKEWSGTATKGQWGDEVRV